MAQTPWEMAAVGNEFSDQSALFAWAAMAKAFGVAAANDPDSYRVAGHAKTVQCYDFERTMTRLEPDRPLTELKWLHAIKNQGHGDRIRGARNKAEGVRPGVSDIFLPVSETGEFGEQEGPFKGGRYIDACVVYHGLYIELKRIKDGKPSDIQLEFQADMRAAGYACEVVYGWEAARDLLLTYLGRSA